MARTIDEIKLDMMLEAQNQTVLKLLFFDTNNNPRDLSQTNIFQAIIHIVALSISIWEQLADVFRTDIEELVALAAPATPQWIKDQVEKFQYDASVPQVITLVDFVPTYATVDESKRIVSRCSVKTDINRVVKVKVAKNEPPVPLATAEENALDAFLTEVLPAGVQRSIINLASDKLWIDANIYYNGQYAATIEAVVIQAIKDYLAALPFDGQVKISSIEDAIQKVPGVTDVVINQVKARADATAFANATTIARYWDTISGYIEEETTAGQTFSDTLTFTVANT